MNICFFGNFTAGGTEKATVLIANALSEHLEESQITILNRIDRNLTFKKNYEVNYKMLMSENILKNMGKINNILTVNYKLHKFLRKNNIDIFICIEAMSGIYSILPTIFNSIKLIVWEHANYYQKQNSKFIDLIRSLELKLSDYYIVLTKKDLKNFKNHFSINTNIDYIYNSIEYISNDNEYDVNSKTIISAGHFNRIKNFRIIPEIARRIFLKHPDWKWKIYGEKEGPEYEIIKKRISEYNLNDNLILSGRTNNMKKAYKEAAIYVLPSIMEGLPMVLLEALSFNIPIISFDIETGPDEVIIDGLNGFLIEPYDKFKMMEKISFLIENRHIRIDMSSKADLMKEKFEMESILNKWKEVLKKIT